MVVFPKENQLFWLQNPSKIGFFLLFYTKNERRGKNTFWAQKCGISLFCAQKWKVVFLRFWPKKGAQNVTFIRGFALRPERMEIVFFVFQCFPIFMSRDENILVAFSSPRNNFLWKNASLRNGCFPKENQLFRLQKSSKIVFAFFTLKTERCGGNAFWALKCEIW